MKSKYIINRNSDGKYVSVGKGKPLSWTKVQANAEVFTVKREAEKRAKELAAQFPKVTFRVQTV